MVVAVLCLVQFVDVLGVTVVVTALPAVLVDLGAPAQAAAPVATGYAMAFGGLLMLGARLGDRFGHRRVLLVGIAVFGLTSLVAAMATTVPVLVAARCGQGAAAAASVPTALRLLVAETARRSSDPVRGGRPARSAGWTRRGRIGDSALAAWSGAGAVAGIAGYLLGGLLTGTVGWRWVFWVNLPLALGLWLAVRARVPNPPGAATTRLDVPGAALLTGTVMAAVLGAALLERPGNAVAGLAVIAAGAALLAAFVAVERRTADPLVPAAAVREPRLRLGVGAALVNTATTSSALTLATLHLQQTRGLGPAAAALWLVPCSLGVVAGSLLAAPLLRRCTPRTGIVAGLSVVAVGDALLLALPVAAALLPVGVALAGLGLGVSSVAANAVGTDVPAEVAGTAAGALNTAAQLGTALGVSALLLLAGRTQDTGLPLAGTPLGWAAAAALAAATALGVAAHGRRPVERTALSSQPGRRTCRSLREDGGR